MVIASGSAVREFREQFDFKKLSPEIAYNDHVRETGMKLGAERYGLAGLNIRGINDPWDRTPDTGSRMAASESLDCDARI
jgi:hypothetical protein